MISSGLKKGRCGSLDKRRISIFVPATRTKTLGIILGPQTKAELVGSKNTDKQTNKIRSNTNKQLAESFDQK